MDSASGKPITPADIPQVIIGLLGTGGGDAGSGRGRKSTGGIPEGKKKGGGRGEDATPAKKKSRKSMA